MYSDSLSAALDEVYIYASALDASDIEVLYGSVSAAPTVTPVPTSHLFEGSLVAYYPFVDGTTQDAHHTWHGTPESMTTTEGRDGSTAIVLDAERWDIVWLPWEVVRDLDGDADRTVCLWARIDKWAGGYLFHYGGSGEGCTPGYDVMECREDGTVMQGFGCQSCDDCATTHDLTAETGGRVTCEPGTNTYYQSLIHI